MAYIDPIDLPGKRVRYRTGFDGYEPWCLRYFYRKMPSDSVRLAVAVDSLYPGVCKHRYINRQLLACMVECILLNQFYLVEESVFVPGGTNPVEQAGTLMDDDVYMLVDSHERIVGKLGIWYYWLCKGGPFYREIDPIIDLFVSKDLLDGIKDSINRQAERYHVAVEDWGNEAERPWLIPRKAVQRWLARTLHGTSVCTSAARYYGNIVGRQ